jgi:hypothetical protein
VRGAAETRPQDRADGGIESGRLKPAACPATS